MTFPNSENKKNVFFQCFGGDLEGAGTFKLPPPQSYCIQKPPTIRDKAGKLYHNLF